MKRFSVVCLLVLACAGCFLFIGYSVAQTTNATVSGQITDPSGGVVPGVAVVLTNLNTSVPYTTLTNDQGIYRFAAVQPGVYRANVMKDGFASIVKGDIELHVQDQVSMNFALRVGSVSEVMTVEAGASMINTTDASVSMVVDQSYIKNMPLNGRSFQDLILLSPGVVYTGGNVGSTGEFSVNGQRTEENNYTVDGVSANVGATAGFNMLGGGASGTVPAATSLGTTQALVSIDELQEFRVQSSTYSAEYGRSPGGQFAFETKSGTNQYHGTAYDYLRNNIFDANDWFNDYFHVAAPVTRQNDFGGTFGGPVRVPRLYNGKDKTFFFASYEGLRLRAPQPATSTFVPDSSLRSAAPSNVQQVLNAWPVQSPSGIDDTANGIAQFISSWSNPSSIDSTSVRLDRAVSDKLRIFFRFNDTASTSAVRNGGLGGTSPSVNTITNSTIRTYTGGLTSVFSTRVSNDLRLNYSSNDTTRSDVIDSFGGAKAIDLAQLVGFPKSGPFVFLEFPNYFISIDESPLGGAQKQWNLVDSLSMSFGRHRLTLGADYRRLAPHATFNSPEINFFFNSTSDVINNNDPTQNTTFTDTVVFAPAYPLYRNFSAFVEDEWKISQRLNLSFGLRWDVNPAPGATQGLKPFTVQGANPDTWGVAPQGTPLWRTTWYNVAPRLGAAYTLRNSVGWATVLRAGAGTFFDTGQQLGSQGYNGPGFSAEVCCPISTFPGNQSIPTIVPPDPNDPNQPYQAVAAYFYSSHLQLPYTLQWNASIEQALGRSQALTLTYVGAHASRLLEQDLISVPANPHIQTFVLVKNGLTSDYGSLQAQYQRRLTNGLTALASYTWSHCIDYGSSNFALFGYQRGNCDFDLRHNFSGAFSYDLPNVGHGGLANAVLNHWGIDDRFTVRTSLPVLLTGASTFDPVTGRQTSTGLDLISGQPIYLYGTNCDAVFGSLGNTLPCPGGRAINPCAFEFPSATQATYPSCPGGNVVGLVPRNFARGFNAWQMNIAVRREFPIYESLKLQFRAEAFNLFNHPNFGTINTGFGSSTFGQSTATLANSLGGLNSLYQTGGPRSMQFALKLVF